MISPVITASSPRERMRTLTWPGVCPGVGTDKVPQSCFEHGVDGIVEMLEIVVAAGLAQVAPVIELLLPKEVAGLRKCRDPLTIHQLCIPTHVIEVQVRTQHCR